MDDIPPDVQAFVYELAAKRITIETQEDIDRLLAERPNLLSYYSEGMLAAIAERLRLAQSLQKFVWASSWLESLWFLEANTHLLGTEAEATLSALIEAAETEGNPDAVMQLTEHLELLGRCRAVGIQRAFAEKMLPSDSLDEAAQQGLTPEAYLSAKLAGAQLTPEVLSVLAELAASDVEIHNPDDLVAALDSRPELRMRLEGASSTVSSPQTSPELLADLHLAQDAEQVYRRNDDRNALEAATAAYARILDAPHFAKENQHFRLAVVQRAGHVFLQRYQLESGIDDLDRALQCWYQALQETSDESPNRPGYLNNLGAGLYDRFQHTRNPDDLDEAIRLYRQAMAVEPAKSPDLPMYLNNLSIGLDARFSSTGHIEDLEEAIQVLRRAIIEAPEGSPDPAQLQDSLASGLREHYERTGQLDTLEEAIQLYRSAVTATPDESPDWPALLSNLGAGLSLRFKHAGQRMDLDEAIRLYEAAVSAVSEDSPTLSSHLNNLGTALHERYGLEGNLAALDESIDVYRRALSTTTEDSIVLPSILSNLGLALRERFERQGHFADLEQAIQMCQGAVQGTPQGAPDLPTYLASLAGTLRIRFRYSGSLEDLEQAILVYQRAVAETPQGSPKLPIYLTSLGTSLRSRFEQIGQIEDLEQAIRMYQRAIVETPFQSPDLPSRLNNWGNGLRARFGHGGRLEDLEEAIRVYRRAVATTPEGSPDMPSRLNNLGNGLRDISQRNGRLEDLEEAIQAYRKAVKLTPEGSPEIAARLNNLSNGLRERFEHLGQTDDLLEAVRQAELAVAATTSGAPDLTLRLNSLGNALRMRFEHTQQLEHLEEAIRIFRHAVTQTASSSPFLPLILNNLGIALSVRFGVTGQSADRKEAVEHFRYACRQGQGSSPQAVLSAAGNWGRFAQKYGNWSEVAEAYSLGMAMGRQLLARQLQRPQKESVLRDLREMAAPAAYALTKLDQLENAVVAVESGRALLLTEILDRNRHDLEQLPVLGYEDLYRRFQELVTTKEQLTRVSTLEPNQPAYLNGQARLDAILVTDLAFGQVVADIQKIPGYSDFLAEPAFAQIQAAASAIVLVYVLATPAGGLALIVSEGNVHRVWLDELTDRVTSEWLFGQVEDMQLDSWVNALRSWRTTRTIQSQEAWFMAFEYVTRKLWELVMNPIATALRNVVMSTNAQNTSVTFIPTGVLALLPLHAAWKADSTMANGRRYFLDEFVVNYAPSALVMRHIRDAAVSGPKVNLLAIEGLMHAERGLLPTAHTEVSSITGLFDSFTVLSGSDATRQAVSSALPKADVLHFACHGRNNWESPLDSELIVAKAPPGSGNSLTVRDLLDLRLTGGRLATLSACETGIIGAELPDEVIGFASALLQAGFAGVVTSLWSVPDMSTAMLMEQFYRLWRLEKLSPAQALRAAQLWVRQRTATEVAAYADRCYRSARWEDRAELLRYKLYYQNRAAQDPVALPFAHPWYWAAFTLTGV